MENYEYMGDLGSGSYGFVWKCLQRSSGQVVAVKGFKLAHTDKKFLDQAIREVRMLRASCNHPNVVQLLEAFRSSSGRVYMVFEFVERCLSAELHKRFTCGLPAAQTRLVLWQLLCAVAHLHSKKIIHRDIKPGNLLMTANGVVKLCDFGFARTTRGDPYQADRFSSYVVTRWYRSPEMLVSDMYAAPSDIWSLGCTFAELATGRPLFPGTSSLDQLWRIMRCLGALPPSQAERFAAAATAAGLPEPPPPPPRGKSLWQRLPELETRLLDVVKACLHLDPTQRPSAAQLLQMPYFWEIPKLVVGTPLEQLYGEYGGMGLRALTPSSNLRTQQLRGAALPPQAGAPAPATTFGSAPVRGVAVSVITTDELFRTAGSERSGADASRPAQPRQPSVLLSAVAASLLGEHPPQSGSSGSVPLVPLVMPATGPPAKAATAGNGNGVAAGPGPARMQSPPSAAASSSSSSFTLATQQSVNGMALPSPSPPPAGSCAPSKLSPRVTPTLAQQTSGRRLVAAAAMAPTPSQELARQNATAASANTTRDPFTAASGSSTSLGGPAAAEQASGNSGCIAASVEVAAAAQRAADATSGIAGAHTRARHRAIPGGKPDQETDELLGTGGEMASGFGGSLRPSMGLMDDDGALSDEDGHISEDDELMEYFAAKSAGSGVAAGSAASGSRRATTLPSNAHTHTSGIAGTASSTRLGVGGGSSRKFAADGLHGGVHGAHHSLYGSRHGSGSGMSGLSGATPTNRRVAAMVTGSGDGAAGNTGRASPKQVPSAQMKRATVGSYLTVPPPAEPSEAAAAAVEQLVAASASVTAATGRARTATSGIPMGAMSYRGPRAGMEAQTSHGVLPALGHLQPHGSTTTSGLALPSFASGPLTVPHGRVSLPASSYGVMAPQYGTSGNVAGSGHRRALSRQGSIVFNQLMYDALPEIGTPGGAPEVPAGTPPRRRAVMSGFTPCRTAAARAAAEGMPAGAAMAAVMGDAMQSTTTDLSVAFSPIHVGRSVDLMSSNHDSGPHDDAAAGAATPAGAAAAAAAAAAARRHQHRRQTSLASLAEPRHMHQASMGLAGSSQSMAANGPGAGHYLHPHSGSSHVHAAATSDTGMLMGTSAPSYYRPPRGVDTGTPAGSAAGPHTGVAGPLSIPGTAAARLVPGAGAGGMGASVSPSTGTYSLPFSGPRGFAQPLTPAVRSRLASGNMPRESDASGCNGSLPFHAEGEETHSAELDALATWGGTGSPCAPGGGSGVMAPHPHPQPHPHPHPQPHMHPQQHGGMTYAPPPPPGRARVGRWVSGIIDSLPEDREVVHAAYGDWGGQEQEGEDAIQVLPVFSGEWAGGAGAAGQQLLRRASSSGRQDTSAGFGMTPTPPLTSPRGSGPWPPAEPRSGPSGGSVEPRVGPSPGSSSSPNPLQPSGSPRMPLGRSRRNLAPSSLDPQRDASADSAAANGPRPRMPEIAAVAAGGASLGDAVVGPSGQSQSGAGGGRSGGRNASGSSSSGKWPRAKALLGGRLISTLVRKFKEQAGGGSSSDK